MSKLCPNTNSVKPLNNKKANDLKEFFKYEFVARIKSDFKKNYELGMPVEDVYCLRNTVGLLVMFTFLPICPQL